jgi:SAM-dependent methyltransferase
LWLDRNRLVRSDGFQAGLLEGSIARFPIILPDPGISFYREAGGARFHERTVEPFAMSSLDTPVYHAHLEELCPRDLTRPVVDVGGGDGRNAIYLLQRGYQRVIVIDAVAAALARFRDRLAKTRPQSLDSILLIEADARRLPIADFSVQCAISIETLCYLNEDYELGLAECVRILAAGGVLIVSDRDYEGGLVLRLIYHGIPALLESAGSRSLWDGRADALVRSRTFTEQELTKLIERQGLKVHSVRGMSLLPLIFGWLRGKGVIYSNQRDALPAINDLLQDLAVNGRMRRCHVVAAQRDARAATRTSQRGDPMPESFPLP